MMKAGILSASIALAALAACAQAQPVREGSAPAPPSEATTDRKLFALILRPGAAWKPGLPFEQQGLRDHFYYWKGLFDAGRVATAGPLGSDGGLVLLFARDQEEAEAVMRADPAFAAGTFIGDVRPYAPPMVNAEVLSDKD